VPLVKANHGEAITEFRATIRRAPNYPGLHTNLGLALVRLGRMAEPIKQLGGQFLMLPVGR
jgi:Flp pilus assembly protein TadD